MRRMIKEYTHQLYIPAMQAKEMIQSTSEAGTTATGEKG
jgi:hypothetical protein